ncbi:MAG: nucleotide exchange factor GrpE, partial [Verrucomicrobia bacterium]
MKKTSFTEQNKQMKQSASSSPPFAEPAASAAQSETEDPTAGLQADLDRFRDLALRSQADFENYKKRSAREKEEAIRYANSSLLERLVGIIDNFELG